MKVMITGAFGNVGVSTVEHLVKQGHDVRCFDVRTKANEKMAHRFRGKVDVAWGDLRHYAAVAAAVQDRDVVIHLAFIIPKLSITGIGSEDSPAWARSINVGGTQNLIAAIKAQPAPPKIIFSSSLHVYGRTQDRLTLRTVDDPVQATDHYTQHKLECEEMIRSSGLQWAILRFAAVLPLSLRLDPGLFDVPLNNRIEFVHTRDVGYACAMAAVSQDVWGKTLLIGGGRRCQFYFRDMAERLLNAMGVGMLPEDAYSTVPFCTDWLDTAESQRLLHYQRDDFDDYVRDLKALLGYRRYLVWLFRPIVRQSLLRESPFYRRSHPAWARLSLMVSWIARGFRPAPAGIEA